MSLRRGQKVRYHLISVTMSVSKILSQILFVFSQIKDRKHIEQNFHTAARVMAGGEDGTFGAGGGGV